MRRIAWPLALAFLASTLLFTTATLVDAGPSLPKEQKQQKRDDKDSGKAATLLPTTTPIGISATGRGILETEVRRLRSSEVTPKTAIMYVMLSDVSRLKEGFNGSAIAKIIGQKKIQDDIDEALKGLRTTARLATRRGLPGFIQMAYAADVDYHSARSVFRKELGFLVLSPHGDGKFRFAMAATVGLNREPLDEVIDSLMGEIQTQYPQFSSSQRKHRGEKIKTLESASFRISIAYFENLLLVGTGKGTVAEMMDAYVSGRETRLSSDSAFKAAEEDMGKGADVFYRVNLEGLALALKSYMASGAVSLEMAMASYSLPTAGVLWGSMRFEGDAIREQIEIREPIAGATTVAFADTLPVPPKSMGFFPVDTAFYLAASIEPAKALLQIMDDPKTPPQVTGGIAMLNQMLGSKIESDILPAFGGELAIGLVTPPGRPPELLIAMEVKRPEIYSRATDAIDRVLGKNVTVSHFREYVIRYVPAVKAKTNASLLEALVPDMAYSKVGDMFLLATSKRGLEKAIRQYQHKRASLLENPDFTRCTAALRPRRTSLVYADSRGLVELLTGNIPTHSGGPLTGPMKGRAEAELAAKHLFGFGAVADNSSVVGTYESFGPMGPVTGGALALLAGMREGDDGAEGGASGASLENLRRIGVACQLYATDFDRYPLVLSELYAEPYLQDLPSYEAPTGKHAVKTKDDIDTRSDYMYVPGLTPISLSDSIMVYDKAYLHGGSNRDVLLLDGSVQTIPESAFRAMMKAQGTEIKE